MLFGVLRKKIWSNLFGTRNTSRTIQVVMSIAIGMLAVGAILGALEFISPNITKGWLAVTSALVIVLATYI